LSNPYQISKLRREMNGNLKDMIGEYYSVNDILVLPGTKSKEPTKLKLSSKNSFFVDVEAVQRTMVALYGFTPEGNCYIQSQNSWPSKVLLEGILELY